MALEHWKLPLAFDVGRLKADLAQVGDGEWTPHFNKGYYDGMWSGVALRTTEGARVPLFPDPMQSTYVDTPMLERCGYIREVLARFQCPLQVVRLLRLSAGSHIKEHTDYNLSYEDGEVRVHVPIQTNSQVEFYLNGQRVVMGEGECWYVNVNLPHRIDNGGSADRVHLVIDCVLNDWLRGLFPAA